MFNYSTYTRHHTKYFLEYFFGDSDNSDTYIGETPFGAVPLDPSLIASSTHLLSPRFNRAVLLCSVALRVSKPLVRANDQTQVLAFKAY
jgi:hypothetical protein